MPEKKFSDTAVQLYLRRRGDGFLYGQQHSDSQHMGQLTIISFHVPLRILRKRHGASATTGELRF